MTPYWVGTSWKMHKTLAEGLAFADDLAAFLQDCDPRIQPFIMPSFTSVREVKRALGSCNVRVGAQNMHWEDSGPFTGEISPLMLRDCGLDMVEIGHSERREHFGETDRTVGLKTAAALRHGLVPLVCVGETLAERDAGRAADVLTAQVTSALQFHTEEMPVGQLLFAYEPVWAIGEKGVSAPPDYAQAQHAVIKRAASALLPAAPGVLYGGSVNRDNAADLIVRPNIDGLFIGRAAWQAHDYIDILRRLSAVL